jgi:hypothetical protein
MIGSHTGPSSRFTVALLGDLRASRFSCRGKVPKDNPDGSQAFGISPHNFSPPFGIARGIVVKNKVADSGVNKRLSRILHGWRPSLFLHESAAWARIWRGEPSLPGLQLWSHVSYDGVFQLEQSKSGRGSE